MTIYLSIYNALSLFISFIYLEYLTQDYTSHNCYFRSCRQGAMFFACCHELDIYLIVICHFNFNLFHYFIFYQFHIGKIYIRLTCENFWMDSGLWTLDSWRLDSWRLDSGPWTLGDELWTVNARLWTCRLLTAKSRSGREHFTSQLSWATAWLSVIPPSTWLSLCVLCLLMIRLMVVLLKFFEVGEYGFSNVGVGAISGNGCGIQGQNSVTLLQGSEMIAGFHCRNWILCI